MRTPEERRTKTASSLRGSTDGADGATFGDVLQFLVALAGCSVFLGFARKRSKEGPIMTNTTGNHLKISSA